MSLDNLDVDHNNNNTEDERHYLDKNRCDLIKKITNVDLVLDKLLEMKLITGEQYDLLMAQPTRQQKMRGLLNETRYWLNSDKDKVLEYLKKENPLYPGWRQVTKTDAHPDKNGVLCNNCIRARLPAVKYCTNCEARLFDNHRGGAKVIKELEVKSKSLNKVFKVSIKLYKEPDPVTFLNKQEFAIKAAVEETEMLFNAHAETEGQAIDLSDSANTEGILHELSNHLSSEVTECDVSLSESAHTNHNNSQTERQPCQDSSGRPLLEVPDDREMPQENEKPQSFWSRIWERLKRILQRISRFCFFS
ncbi:uncharacterized protein [Hyperolius riggenbachi]|uniref:uncharacterized protein n=1 Tax=Hyperolius riggenbachi TaxID=752182 RepID=UPI0035A2882D